MKQGTLYVVSTPIGNLEDITLRALRILRETDFIAAEDTRRTKILLNNYNIKKPLISYYSYNRFSRKEKVLGLLEAGKNVALVSDAGTPGISDPGYLLIKDAIERNLPVMAIPGPTAFITALVISGKPTDKFVFEGFLSNKSSRRRAKLSCLKNEKRTIVLYESCHRLVKLLEDICCVMGDVELVVARELTKKFEEIKRERTKVLIEHFSAVKPRGEFIVII
ncbi:MAG: 16S rRNA (cytidine(1402)-2'-O)-methyltransferase [Candidatus Omnitrophica bacterium]|nr:16S rRNA (cytidine(1402)-2'-O)-methyltransferase [Candidatus Omnitrophota bacterium]